MRVWWGEEALGQEQDISNAAINQKWAVGTAVKSKEEKAACIINRKLEFNKLNLIMAMLVIILKCILMLTSVLFACLWHKTVVQLGVYGRIVTFWLLYLVYLQAAKQ